MAAAQKRKKVLIAAVGAVVATGAFVAALTLNRTPIVAVPAVTGGTAQVLVAAVPLTPGSKLTSEEVRLVPYPASAVTSDNLTSIKQAVGKYVSVRLNPGSVVLGSQLEASDASAIARTLQPGDVAISIPFDEVKGVGGYVQAEDRIDIICDPGDGHVTTCFHNVRVLRSGSLSQVQTPAPVAAVPVVPAAGPTPVAGPAPVAGALVLVVELSHADAERVSGLLLGGKSGSIVRYALLNPADSSPSPSA